MRVRHSILLLAACLIAAPATVPLLQSAAAAPPEAASPAASESSLADESRHRTERLRGKVVWLAEAVKRRHGVEVDADAAEAMVVLETKDGQLIPLLKDARGRGFLMDKRLRGQPMELLVRRYEGLPVVQVITVYTLHDGKKFELDYWCDICAIPMYELKECECCQGPSRLREREVGPSD